MFRENICSVDNIYLFLTTHIIQVKHNQNQMKKTLIASLKKESKEKRSQADTLYSEADAIDKVLSMYGASPIKMSRPKNSDIEEKSTSKKRKRYSNSRSNSYLNPRMDVLGNGKNKIDYPRFIMEYMAGSNRTYCKTTDIYLKLTKKYGDADRNMYQKVLENMKLLKKRNAVEIKVLGNNYTWKLTDSGRKQLSQLSKLGKDAKVKRKYTKRAKPVVSKKKKKAKKVGREGVKVNGLSVKEIASQLKVSPRTVSRKLNVLTKEKKPLTDIFNEKKSEKSEELVTA